MVPLRTGSSFTLRHAVVNVEGERSFPRSWSARMGTEASMEKLGRVVSSGSATHELPCVTLNKIFLFWVPGSSLRCPNFLLPVTAVS